MKAVYSKINVGKQTNIFIKHCIFIGKINSIHVDLVYKYTFGSWNQKHDNIQVKLIISTTHCCFPNRRLKFLSHSESTFKTLKIKLLTNTGHKAAKVDSVGWKWRQLYNRKGHYKVNWRKRKRHFVLHSYFQESFIKRNPSNVFFSRQLVTEVSDAWAKVAKENNGFLHIVRTLHATNPLEKSATSEFLSLKEMNWLSDKAVVSHLLLDPDS